MGITDIIKTPEAEQGFYPTPAELVHKLISGEDALKAKTILEPSAGKGNLIDQLVQIAIDELRQYRSRYDNIKMDVDCIEIDPYLRSILKYEFGGQREEEIRNRLRVLNDKQSYSSQTRTRGVLTPEEAEEEKHLEAEKQKRACLNTYIVHDDFLTYESRKKYDLIIMNPPFSNGDEHLLKAIELQSRHGGKIRCILNAETIRNAYSNRRKTLIKKLDELGAEISYETGAFADGERRTLVEVALIKIDIPEPYRESDIYERLRKAANIDKEPDVDVTDLTVADFMQRIVSQFNVEADAGLELIKEYRAMQPYILRDINTDSPYNKPNLTLTINGKSQYSDLDENDFIKVTRRKYWEALFHNKEFMGRLTTNLREKYVGMVDRMVNYDFSLFNIQQVSAQMNVEMNQGIQDTIVALFDKMTQQHSWYPECEKNVHYFSGWKTNKAHKITNKVILPVHGMFADYSWSKETFKVHNAENTISDIEKVFEYLDGNMTAHVDLHGTLERACAEGRTKNIQCKFFDVTLYKKGTMHIKFHNPDLVNRFNIYCCGKKAWLPPCYGNKSYSNMTTEEKSVVDGFHGNGSEGSGEKAYTEVMNNRTYFLAEPTNQIKALPGM